MSSIVRHGLLSVPVPQFDVHPLLAAARPFVASIKRNPSSVTSIAQDASTRVPSASVTLTVGVARPSGTGHDKVPVLRSIVMPSGPFAKENVYGKTPPMAATRMLYSILGNALEMRFPVPPCLILTISSG